MFRHPKEDTLPLGLKNPKRSKDMLLSFRQTYKSCCELLKSLEKNKKLIQGAVSLWQDYKETPPIDRDKLALINKLSSLFSQEKFNFSFRKSFVHLSTLLDSIKALVLSTEAILLSLENELRICNKMVGGKMTDYYTFALEHTDYPNELSLLQEIMGKFDKLNKHLRNPLLQEFEQIFDDLGNDEKQPQPHCRP